MLLFFYLGNRKETAAFIASIVTPEELRERTEKESKKAHKEYMTDRRIQSLESSINPLRESVAQRVVLQTPL